MLLSILHCSYLVNYNYQINFPGWGWGWVAGLSGNKTRLKVEAELGNKIKDIE